MISIIGTLFQIAEKSLSIYETKLSRKYLEKYVELKKDILAELAKPIVTKDVVKYSKLRDQNKLDHMYLELKLLLETFVEDMEKYDKDH